MNHSSAETTSRADVAVDTPERYAKQLGSHLGNKLNVRYVDDSAQVLFPDGECLIVPNGGLLELRVRADNTVARDRIENVIGSHLERFGARAGLVVTWTQSP